jgi:hypothetical protein
MLRYTIEVYFFMGVRLLSLSQNRNEVCDASTSKPKYYSFIYSP